MTPSSNQIEKSGPQTGKAASLQHDHRARRLNATKNALLITYSQILVKGNRHVCEPRPDTVIDLLKRRHHNPVKRRWFFQCMLDLEVDGFLKRKRRPRHMPDNTVHSKPSLWSFTYKGAQYLFDKAVVGAKELISGMITWFHKDDKRFPGPSDIFPGEERTERSVALARLQELLATIGSGPVGGGAPATT